MGNQSYEQIYYINLERPLINHALSKAPDDISSLCKSLGCQELKISMANGNFFLRRLKFLIGWMNVLVHISKKSIILYQHPTTGIYLFSEIFKRLLKMNNNCKVIGLLHDCDFLRNKIFKDIGYSNLKELSLLKCFDAIICHNEHMRQYLIEQGFQADKLVNLDIFDYLDNNERVQPRKSENPTIAIAANLRVEKAGYIYDVIDEEASRNTSLVMNLYGNNFDPSKAKPNMVYKGSFKPDELSKYLEGDFGLVWDGISAETCKGNTGEYLRYNNPHKASFYLSAGMPVIVWREAAIADFILENGVGIAVDSLYDLEEQIAKVSPEEYAKMCENVKKIQKRLHNGYYFKTAFEKALEIIQ